MITESKLADTRAAFDPYFNKIAAFETADQIRDFLVTEGVKARRELSTSCALAQYMRRSELNVHVYGDATHARAADSDGTWREPCWIKQENTKAMARFVDRFDNGHSPELEAS